MILDYDPGAPPVIELQKFDLPIAPLEIFGIRLIQSRVIPAGNILIQINLE